MDNLCKLLLETERASTASILLFLSLLREPRPILIAHHTTLMVPLSPGLQLVESQSHLAQTWSLISRSLNATELQRLIWLRLPNTDSHLPPPCSQEDACPSTLKLPLTTSHWLSPVKTK